MDVATLARHALEATEKQAGSRLEPARARCPRVRRRDGRARELRLEHLLKGQRSRHDHSDWLLPCWLLRC